MRQNKGSEEDGFSGMTGPVLTVDLTRVLFFSARDTRRAQEYAKLGALAGWGGLQILG